MKNYSLSSMITKIVRSKTLWRQLLRFVLQNSYQELIFLIMITMFVGRIGPLTLALAVALQEDKALYVYPEEKLMVG